MSLLGGATVFFGFIDNYAKRDNNGRDSFALPLLFLASAGLSAIAGLLYQMNMTSLFGTYVFAFAALGLRWPTRLLEVFIFLVALGHRDFTYIAIDLGGRTDSPKVFITEWVLLILMTAALPRLWREARRVDHGIWFISAFLTCGTVLFALTFIHWPPLAAFRDFAIVYYSLFAVAVMVHVKDYMGVRRIAGALLLGSLPNLAMDLGNYLYGTFPITQEQRNISFRNSYYYLVSLGFVLPFVSGKGGRPLALPSAYCIIVYMVVLLYSYSKTAMVATMILTIFFYLPRFRETSVASLAVVALLFIMPFFLTPHEKVFPFLTLFSSTTYLQDIRALLQYASVQDFSEYPYGIGFGSPIFGEHSHEIIQNVESFHAIHNSYLTVMRRMGVEGILTFAILNIAACYASVRTYRKSLDNGKKKLALGAIFSWITCMVFLYAHVALEGPFLGSVYWCVVGCLFVVGRSSTVAGSAITPPERVLT